MRRAFICSVLTFLALFLASDCRAQSQRPEPESQDRNTVVRLSVTLIQVDAVVSDAQGRQLTDLAPGEFEVTVRGRRQHVTTASYRVGDGTTTAQGAAVGSTSNSNAAPAQPPAQVQQASGQLGMGHRATMFVVDDLLSSLDSIKKAKALLLRYVDQEMRPGDVAAIGRTALGVGAMQTFTSDRDRLRQAIERIQWSPTALAHVHSHDSIDFVNVPRIDAMAYGADRKINEFRTQEFAASSLLAVGFYVRQLAMMPGRKTLVLISDGFPIPSNAGPDDRIYEPLHKLIDLANRSAVTIHALNPLGQTVTDLVAADSFPEPEHRMADRVASNRRWDLVRDNQGLEYLAEETGGFSVVNSNNLSAGLDRILADQEGYYEIGFVPDDELFKKANNKPTFNDVVVKVKRAGARVRSRRGFYGYADTDQVKASTARAGVLYGALFSPTSLNKIGVDFTTLYGANTKIGPFIRVLIHIKAKDLTYTDEPGGSRGAALDILAVTFGGDGEVEDLVNRTENIRVKDADVKSLNDRGLVDSFLAPVKHPGLHQMRLAVRDGISNAIGTANQFVDIPDLTKGELALSGIVVSKQSGQKQPPSISSATDRESQEGIEAEETAAIRQFSATDVIGVALEAFNIQNAESVALQVRLYRDGKLVGGGPLSSLLHPRESPDGLPIYGALRLSGIAEGHYALEVECTEIGKKRPPKIRQAIDRFRNSR